MSNPVNYLCVDDAGDTATHSYLDFISDQDERLNIEPSEPDEFSLQLTNLKEKIRPDEGVGFDGLLLDLRLDGEGSKAHYRAPALAQEIHTRAVEDKDGFPICPLVLWSNDEKLDDSYWPDDTSHDLFDLTIFKEKLADLDVKYARKTARKLISLADGYSQIIALQETGFDRISRLLDKSSAFLRVIDPRIALPLGEAIGDASVYDQARFIHQQLLTIPNSALVSSEILAARLGLDIRDVKDFDDLAEKLFPNARYTGAFAYGWPCWWVSGVEKGWANLAECPGPLRTTGAEKRVECIKRNSDRQDIHPATTIELTTSTTFWTICQITRQPLDPMEGYAVDKQLYPWQNTKYVSLHGKLSGGRKADRTKIDPLDIERFEEDSDNR
ncbi:hypothetical protein [Hymenobacter sp.]|jgi:hypothetical protein|uniref:hypothetical protein n=1 Tax=Hymenobacter sp. TaxID=1898978 RepID=UPI002ED895F1